MHAGISIFPARAAVSLTYDDGLDVHLDHAIPDLGAAGLRGSFYVPTQDPGNCWHSRLPEWKAAAAKGHEIGNHTQYHPCSADWVKPNFRLEAYTIARIEGELVGAERDLSAGLGGPATRSYAYTCSQDFVSPQRESYRPVVDRLFPAARIGAARTLADPMTLAFCAVPSWQMNATTTLHDVLQFFDEAAERGAWAVLHFHGVGGGHRIDVGRAFHREICKHLSVYRDRYWTDTFLNVAQHIRKATRRPWG